MNRRFCIYVFFLLVSVVAFGQDTEEYPKLTNIPTVYIETFNGQRIESKDEYIYANMVYVNDTAVIRYDSLKIRGRGNSTWGLAKKPYRIKFKESTKFLGKGFAKNKSWVFLANHADKSLLRNAVTFTMGEFMGLDFNPAAQFVDLVLNGTYVGNYQITDQINVDNKRVEIFEQEEPAGEDANITGGYLLEVDGFGYSEPYRFYTERGVLLSIKSPDEDVINNRQVEYIKGCLNGFENALFSNNFTDPENGYRAHVDSASFVNWYMATELSANVDGFWSTYMYKEKDDPKLYFGPLWDYDIAYNNCNRVGDVMNRTMVDAAFADDLSKKWVKQAMNDPWFNKAVNDAWKSKIDEGIVEYLCNYIDSMANLIDASQKLNYGKYTLNSRVYNEIYIYSTYSEYIQQLKEFIVNHSAYLTTVFDNRVTGGGDGDGGDGVLEPFEINEDYYYRIYNKGTNKVLDLQDDGNGNYNVVMFSPVSGRASQLWIVEPFEDGFRFINSETGYAFNDPDSKKGNTLTVVPVDETDYRQKWYVVTVNKNYNYNVINAHTDFAINNSGGFGSDGNPVISYTNDDKNSTSNNRQWSIVPEELIPDYIDEEVKAALNATIAEAEDFISGLDETLIGDGYFLYAREEIARLEKMVADAKAFESTLADDYILQNVNLAKQIDVASKVKMPEENKPFIIKYKQIGYALNVTSEDVNIVEYDRKNNGLHMTFMAAGDAPSVALCSSSGLFATAEAGVSAMYGTEICGDGAVLAFEPADDGYYIRTANGYMGVVVSSDGTLRVYSDKVRSESQKWIIEEFLPDVALEAKEAELDSVVVFATKELDAIDYKWVGEKPFQISMEKYEALDILLDEMADVYYGSAEEYDDAIGAISAALAELEMLNVPDASKRYNLVLGGDKYLNFTNGLLVDDGSELDASHSFAFLPVDGKANTYNICFAGMYLSVVDASSVNMLVLADTPRGSYGDFVVEQVGSETFTLATACGLLGVAGESPESGDACVPDAQGNAANVCWAIMEALETGDDDYTGIADYSENIDYCVSYNKELQTLGFVSYDIEKMAGVDVSLYTVGGRLLYTFKATEELSLRNLPSGTYIINWNWAGKERNVKFRKE